MRSRKGGWARKREGQGERKEEGGARGGDGRGRGRRRAHLLCHVLCSEQLAAHTAGEAEEMPVAVQGYERLTTSDGLPTTTTL